MWLQVILNKNCCFELSLFYDPTIGETCDENICLEVSKFREHLDYLKTMVTEL